MKSTTMKSTGGLGEGADFVLLLMNFLCNASILKEMESKNSSVFVGLLDR